MRAAPPTEENLPSPWSGWTPPERFRGHSYENGFDGWIDPDAPQGVEFTRAHLMGAPDNQEWVYLDTEY